MLHLLLFIAVVGVIVWAINSFIPMPDGFKRVIYAVGIVIVVLAALAAFGVAVPLHF